MSDTGKKVREKMAKIKELNAKEKPEIDAHADEVAKMFPEPTISPEKVSDAFGLSDGKKGSSIRGGSEAPPPKDRG